MADLIITAASVVAGSATQKLSGIAGATITAGQTLYVDPADSNKLKLFDSDSATSAVRVCAGVALHGASLNQPIQYATKGLVTIGATVAAGTPYYASDTPGGICPFADMEAGDYPCFIGFGVSATVIDINIVHAGVAIP